MNNIFPDKKLILKMELEQSLIRLFRTDSGQLKKIDLAQLLPSDIKALLFENKKINIETHFNPAELGNFLGKYIDAQVNKIELTEVIPHDLKVRFYEESTKVLKGIIEPNELIKLLIESFRIINTDKERPAGIRNYFNSQNLNDKQAELILLI